MCSILLSGPHISIIAILSKSAITQAEQTKLRRLHRCQHAAPLPSLGARESGLGILRVYCRVAGKRVPIQPLSFYLDRGTWQVAFQGLH